MFCKNDARCVFACLFLYKLEKSILPITERLRTELAAVADRLSANQISDVDFLFTAFAQVCNSLIFFDVSSDMNFMLAKTRTPTARHRFPVVQSNPVGRQERFLFLYFATRWIKHRTD